MVSILFCGFAFAMSGQQDWLYSMQALNLYDGNAAAAGMYERNALHLRYRHMWLGVDGAPQTLQASWHNAVGQKLGVGARIQTERAGAFDRGTALVHLAYRLRLRKSELAFALGGGLRYEQLVSSRLEARDQEDPLFAGDLTQSAPLAQAAVMWRNKRFFIGAEFNRWLTASSTWGMLTTEGRYSEALLMAGSTHSLNANLALRPMLALRWSEAGAILPEAQIGAWWRQTLWLGFGRRLEAASYAFAEYRYRGKFRLAYSVGLASESIARRVNHEIMIGLLWGGGKRRSIGSSTYFQ